jgi:hypothetical protein
MINCDIANSMVTRPGVMLCYGQDKSRLLHKKNMSVIILFICDEIFEIKIKNLSSIYD